MEDAIDRWNSDHAIRLRNFLNSDTGQLALEILRLLKPQYALDNDPYLIARCHGRQEGYEKCPENLWVMTDPKKLERPESDVTQYPSLDDESHWDGNTPKP